MSGATSLRGLVFQQRYTTYRVLFDIAAGAINASADTPRIRRFSIEGRTSEDAPAWDIRLELDNDDVELNECKDTAITQKDRLIFYDRLRDEVANGTPVEKIVPKWTTDPTKQPPNLLTHLDGIAETVMATDLASLDASQPKRVTSKEKAIQEAVFRLCYYDGTDDDGDDGAKAKKKSSKKPCRVMPSPCTLDEAKALLARLRVDRHQFGDLDQSVKLLATGALSKGVASAVNKYVTGVLSERIVTTGEANFTIDEFFQEIGTTAAGIELEGRLRDIYSFGAATGHRPKVRFIEWRNLPGSPVTRWELSDRIPTYDPTNSTLILAPMGTGKTVASHLALDRAAESQSPDRVLRVEAGSQDPEDIEALVKLMAILTAIGPAWLTVDALDEAPTQYSSDWDKAITALLGFSNLALLITARKEVFTVREWMSKSTSILPRMEMTLLSMEQIGNAFASVKLPIPANDGLIRTLRNPFLFSLYADIVSTDDMPLAQSGEVAAFNVISEFWKRRVTGISVGQRAEGESEGSQIKKRRAAALLGDMGLDGNRLVLDSIDDADILAGIEMLALEGVIENTTATRVRWSHDWLREYSLVDQLITRCDSISDITIARRIVSDCTIDDVARTAAAGAMKWVIANPDTGTANQFLEELWQLDKGLTRESLVVALEARSNTLVLAELPGDLLVESIVLAKHLSARQWDEQISSLPEDRFQGEAGSELHRVVVDFELDVDSGAVLSADSAVRLVARDLARSKSGHGSILATFELLRKAIFATNAFDRSIVKEWLIAMAGLSNDHLFGKLFDSVTQLISSDQCELAHSVFRATMRMGDSTNGPVVAHEISTGRFTYERQLKELLEHSGLIADNIDTWGATAVDLLTSVVLAKQKDVSPLDSMFIEALAEQLGEEPVVDRGFHPNYDQDPRLITLDTGRGHNHAGKIAEAIQKAFVELAKRDDATEFRQLADHCVNTRYAAIIVFPLIALLDALGSASEQHNWHKHEALRLLATPRVADLESLDDVRRLMRLCLMPQIDEAGYHTIVDAVRMSSVQESVQTREFADLMCTGLLKQEESDRVAVAQDDLLIDEPADPRENPLFRTGGSVPDLPRRSQSSWPHADDAEHINTLNRIAYESDVPSDDGSEPKLLQRQLDALRTLTERDEFFSDDWIGKSLGWCSRVIHKLRHSVETIEETEHE